jgi:amino acid adenylation domain-containing protein
VSDRRDTTSAGSAQASRERLRALLRAGQAQPRVFPLSLAQQRLWFMEQFQPGTPLYNIHCALALTGRLDPGSLQAALSEIVARHDALRTSFPILSGRPVQLVAPAQAVRLAVEDVDADHVHAIATEEARRPFDVAHGPLLRVRLLRTAPERHVLLLTIHHIIADGWSATIFVRELHQLYGAFVRGLPSPLAPLPIQYPDFALWQRERLQGAALAAQLAYWRQHLAGAPGALDLPVDRPHPPEPSYRGGQIHAHLPAQLADDLRRLGRAHGATLFMTMLAAFAALLHRYTQQRDIVVGTPVASRDRTEIEGLIGCFVNTLPLRLGVAGEQPFSALLAHARATAVGAYANQEVPFEKIVEELRVARDLGRSPLFQAMLVLQEDSLGELSLPELSIALLPLESGTAKFDLTLELAERDGLQVTIEYNGDIWDPARAERMAGHLERLLRSVTARPDAPVSRLELLPDTESHQVLVAGSAGAGRERPEPLVDADVHRWFEACARAAPDAIAIQADEAQWTYGQLHQRAERLAHALRRLGAGPEVPVAAFLGRTSENVQSFLATLAAGAVFVSLDPAWPRERLAAILGALSPRVIITRDAVAHALPAHHAHVLLLDRAQDELPDAPPGELAPAHHPDGLAYIMHTSGSTGVPKGVMVTRAGIANRMRWEQAARPLGRTDAVLHAASVGFDASLWEMLRALGAGARLVIAPPDIEEDHARLLRCIAEGAVTEAGLVPSVLELLLAEQRRHPGIPAFAGLRRLVCAGERLTRELVAALRASTGAAIENFYGQTEVSIDATSWPCAEPSDGPSIPIGRPFAGMRAYVLDEHLQPVPVGVWGELFLAGPGLARGYAHRPDQTAELFVPCPFAATPGERMYRTGDRCRFSSSGYLELRGRTDHQVKINGVRVELGEIETALRRHPGVREAVVVSEAAPGPPGRAGAGDGELAAALLRCMASGTTIELSPAQAALLEQCLDDIEASSDREA